MKILITGAGGFTGRYLTRELKEKGHEIHGIVHQGADIGMAHVDVIHACDLLDSERLAQVVDRVRPDRVVHLAAIAFVAHGDIDEMYRTNVIGTRHLLEALAHAPKCPESILLASSANIYGNAHAGMIDEEAYAAPANDYGVTKIASEHVAGLYAEKLPIIVTRPFNYTGVGQPSNFLIPKIVDHIRRKSPLIELGNLDIARDFSDVRTVANIYARLLDCQEAIGQTFNVCSGRALPLADIVEMLRRLSGHAFETRINPAFVRANEIKSLCGNPARLERLIGPTGMPPFEETLRWMLEG